MRRSRRRIGCSVRTVENLRERLVTAGFDAALERKKRATPPTPRKLDGVGEAKLIAMRLGKPPAGYGRWSLQLLADELVALESRRFDLPGDGASQDAKKNGMTKRKIEYWVIPPDQDAEFVADMEDVLETYAEAYDPQHPVLCMDEQPVQLLKETQVPIAATKEHREACRLRIRAQRHGEHLHVRGTAVGLSTGDRP